MGITINDLRRAILADGDISVFAEVYSWALGGAPVPVTSRWDVPLRLPEPNVLADYPDAVFSNQLSRRGRSNATLTDGQLDLTLVVVAPNGKNSGTYLERVIEETRPDVIALDISPIGLSADILYAFSLYNALGIPTCAEIRHRDSGQLYLTREFYPGGMTESAIIRSWLGKIPLVLVGQRSKRTMNLEELESAVWESELTAAQTTLDEELENTLNLETSNLITARIGDSLLKSLSGEQRESLSNEACYIASRIIDIAASTPGRKVRILAIVDLPHYPDIEELRKGLEPGVAAEIYVPQRAEVKPAEMTMIRSDRDASVEVNHRPISEPNLAQRLFVNQFNDFIQTRDNEVLALTEARRLVTEITSRIRPHPGVRLGVS